MVEPPLVLMDEPLSNLDAKLRLEMRAEIRRIHTMLGCSTIYVTHDQEEALSLADRILVMIDGQTRQIGSPEDLYSRPAHADVAEFMGYRNLFRSRAQTTDDGIVVAMSGARLLGTPMEAVGAEAMVAIRPDDLQPRSGGPVPATVELAEYHGRDFYALARGSDGTELYFRSPMRVNPGEMVRLDAPRERVLVYRRMSGAQLSLRRRLRERGLDSVTLLVLPGVLFVLVLFVYPFLMGSCCRSRRRREAAGWRTTGGSSPIRSSTTRSGSPCRSPYRRRC